jgi:hypothetical protein
MLEVTDIPKPEFPETVLFTNELLLPLITNPLLELPETVFPESVLPLEEFKDIPNAKFPLTELPARFPVQFDKEIPPSVFVPIVLLLI